MKTITKILLVLLLGIIVISCNNNKTTTEKELKKEKTLMEKEQNRVTTNATPLPAYMGFILNNSSEFNITEEQKNKLLSLKSVIMSKARPLKLKIAEIDEKLKQLSMDNVKFEAIEKLSKEGIDVRLRFADIKTECRDSIFEVVDNVQWSKIVESYKEKNPYEMDNILERISAVPNYMIIVYNVDGINLTDEQKTEINRWNKEVHHDAMMMQNNIVLLEKEIREISLERKPKDEILAKVKELEELRHKLLLVKTKCRDFIFNNVLTNDQWNIMLDNIEQ